MLFNDVVLNERIVAIIRGVDAAKTVKAVQALYDGGIRIAEITFNQSRPETFEETAEVIRVVAETFDGKMIIGAGTVVSTRLVDMVAASKGKFIITPNINLGVIQRAHDRGLVPIPGAMTPSEIMTAYDAGSPFIKLFPAVDLGINYVKNVRAPLSHVPLLAVGGIDEKNVSDFLAAGCVGVGVGGALVNGKLTESGNFDQITRNARNFVQLVKK
jgi:2-dehydro-3-deoxyphosphogluconate aldolase/(4S)-4-hydroxy-2-oxoglutarate aldolase